MMESFLRGIEKLEISYRKEYADEPVFLAMAFFYTNHLTVEAATGQTPEEAIYNVSLGVDRARRYKHGR